MNSLRAVINYKKKLIIGTAQFGMNYGISNKLGKVPMNCVKDILRHAYDNSINSLDTAKAYGQSEELIGNYLQFSNEKWRILTKLDSNSKMLIKELKDSEKKLSVIPHGLLAHSADLFIKPEFQNQIKNFKKAGVSSVGVSVYSEQEINLVLKSNSLPDIIQLPMNILDSKLYKNGVIDRIFTENIEIHVRSVFLQGLFYLSEGEIKKRFNSVYPTIIKLNNLAKKAGLTLPELSLLWLCSLNKINKIVIGVNSLDHLKNHLLTLEKNINSSIFCEALKINFEDENILNPSKWT